MNRRWALRNLIAASAGSYVSHLFAAASPDKTQTPKSDSDKFTLYSDVRLVLLDVSVQDRRAEFVTGLSKENFSITENGRAQTITVFGRQDRPVTVGLLVDESRSMSANRNEVITAAQVFIEESNREDEIFVFNFNDRVTAGLPPNILFSDDIPQLRSALYRGVPQGKTALNDAVVAGLDQLRLGRRDKKTLVIISDGGDNASHHRRMEMLDAVEKSLATIYTVGLFEPDNPDLDRSILRQLAGITGGAVYFPKGSTEIIAVCERIAKDIRARYTVGYRPTGGDGSIRQIRVHVAAPGHGTLIARTRGSYRYDERRHE